MKFSIIIPVYNVEKYIEKCLRSLFEQTLDDIEYIFIDDCSPDNSIHILNNVIRDYPNRINQTIIYTMPNNMGVSTVRRQGIYMATGEYIANCDSDDWVDKDIYRIMYEKAIMDNCDIVRCNFVRCNEYYSQLCSTIPHTHFLNKELLLSDLIKGTDLSSLSDKLIKRRLFKDNQIIYPVEHMFEDYVIITQLLYYSNHIGYIDKVLYYYYQNPESICHGIDEPKILSRLSQQKTNVDLIIDFLNDKNILHKYKKEVQTLKFSAREVLLPIIHKSGYHKIWYSIYPEINVFKLIGVKKKLTYILVSLHLYTFIKTLYDKLCK